MELENQEQGAQFKEKVKFDAPAQTLEESLNKLVKFGGFDFLESTIDGVANMNPERKARKKIFLSESDKKSERKDLAKKMELWVDMLSASNDVGEMMEQCTAKSHAADKIHKKNLKKALDATAQLEQAYRSVSLFYANSESDKLKNVTFVNASMEQLKDLDNPRFIDYVGDELKQNFDRLDLRDNYSLMVIPGYL